MKLTVNGIEGGHHEIAGYGNDFVRLFGYLQERLPKPIKLAYSPNKDASGVMSICYAELKNLGTWFENVDFQSEKEMEAITKDSSGILVSGEGDSLTLKIYIKGEPISQRMVDKVNACYYNAREMKHEAVSMPLVSPTKSKLLYIDSNSRNAQAFINAYPTAKFCNFAAQTNPELPSYWEDVANRCNVADYEYIIACGDHKEVFLGQVKDGRINVIPSNSLCVCLCDYLCEIDKAHTDVYTYPSTTPLIQDICDKYGKSCIVPSPDTRLTSHIDCDFLFYCDSSGMFAREATGFNGLKSALLIAHMISAKGNISKYYLDIIRALPDKNSTYLFSAKFHKQVPKGYDLVKTKTYDMATIYIERITVGYIGYEEMHIHAKTQRAIDKVSKLAKDYTKIH